MKKFVNLTKNAFIKKASKYIPYLVLISVSLWSIFPIILKPATSYFKAGDDGLITWQINQTIQKIPNNLENIFETNIFYPYKHTLAYTNLAVPSAVIGYLPVKLTESPFAAYNSVIILTQFLSASFLYLLFKKITQNAWASVIGSLSLLLSKFHMQSIAHIHVFMMHWWLISAYLLWLYKDGKKVKYLYLAALFFIIQLWESFYQAFWIILFGFLVLTPEFKYLKKQLRHILFITPAIFVLASPIFFAYLDIVRGFGQLTSIRTVSHFSMSFNDIWESNFSLGIYINFILSLVILRKNFLKNKKLRLPIILLLLGLILALGPVLKWNGATHKFFGKYFIPLPYTLFYYLIPGFSALRSVDRFFGISFFAMAMIVAISLTFLPKSKKLLVGLIFFTLSIIGGKQVDKTHEFPAPSSYPKVYSWLENQPGKVILEYPPYTWIDDNYSLEMYRMVYSLKHHKYLINGASGFMPPERGKLLSDIKSDLPNNILDQRLRDLGVDYLIVHKDETERKKLFNFESDSKLRKIYDDYESAVYSYVK
ncbi:hypothetical protein A2962_01070 [Candidatus Woesebacteria bacterium RIFCSPLOWO2_01_FULL_39_61]|uniref:Glycosyltransferase RgtA/B/C/D-like domain-containing protein n=1 Tax=Candidatus Woesebacteria bacterium RIFCSPHIGHO2_02_FULL_39_13 TaxID=1802505 RepID=A0A1F7YYD5_9BACT|nr:MAG: hypothetical protein A2692_04600 [Candidatus Woesebacteria bacterium RIFCSPHIGHO2_01_FULL_39_95]OGM32287.1 MAG: hypothetical protein A3D01_06520 [Candidatus Woesebacteria bacterium RIFCSPHIGHO2_02_FULL_39_13]OGM37055.1 MAG: hypothetical protein A3E13_00555 [Candidatus Woesebacteria bacterium RIFCSPHIGHO2_12_FULL_40_20]OGM65449.1 MAG: hypothetical protein A2962_01070 [Candidatus Woesebacteria bacterium RIFCSPLOWO2_01_FULL_39_61]OGM75186.1 MAG: hypothetical protein A3H19_06100 [Candidatus